MIFEINGVWYEFTRGSDVANNGMFLEAYAVEQPGEILLFAFVSDIDGAFSFSAFQHNLPFALVEKFVEVARASLPLISENEF